MPYFHHAPLVLPLLLAAVLGLDSGGGLLRLGGGLAGAGSLDALAASLGLVAVAG